MKKYIKDLIVRSLFGGWFKEKFLMYIRRNRFYYPDVSTDFTFVAQQYSPRPPSAHLTQVCLDCVNNIHDDLIPKFNKIIESGDAKHIFDFSNHYLFLLALANVTQAKQIVEVGTASGSSLWAWLNAKCVEHVYTFDIVPIEDSQHWFTSSTHSSTVNEVLASERRRFTQYIEDLSVDANFDNRRSFIEHADIIFIDGPHDGNFERKIFSRITKLKFRRNVYVVLDDIRVSSMVDFWEDIQNDKLDITGFAHSTGTGIVFLKASP